MRTCGRRTRWSVWISLAVILAAGIVLARAQREPLLLRSAARIDVTDCRETDCRALSPHELVWVDLPAHQPSLLSSPLLRTVESLL